MRPKNRRPSSLKLVKGATSEEEIEQMLDVVAEHPWALTFRAFIERLAAEYKFSLSSFSAIDPQQEKVEIPFFTSAEGRRFYLPAGLEMDAQLDPYVTASLCRQMGIPPEDFGLLPNRD